VWQIAWPSVLTFALMTTNAILDRMFVGSLGRDALAAVGVGGQLLFFLVSINMGITVGTTALVARFTGADNLVDACMATGQSLTLGLAIGLACSLGVYAGLGPYIRIMALDSNAAELCRVFVQLALFGMTPMFVVGVFGAAFRGLGDTKTPLKVMICANIVHISCDWVLIFGRFGFPKMGLAGAGVAIALSNVAAMAVYWYLLRRSPLGRSLEANFLKLTMEWAKRILRIGIPAAVTALLRVTSLMSFTGVLARTAEGMSGVAALPIGLTAESIAFMPGFGYSVAASALVGQSLGARDPERAERYGWAATWQAVAIMSAMGALFFVLAGPFVRIFTSDAGVAALAVSYLRIMAISEPMLAVGMVLTGALQGAGDTTRPAVATAFTFWIFRLPACWYFALRLGYGTTGGWVAMSLSTILGGVVTIILFKRDSWKQIRV
jgi:putative MATE family efflux protein